MMFWATQKSEESMISMELRGSKRTKVVEEVVVGETFLISLVAGVEEDRTTEEVQAPSKQSDFNWFRDEKRTKCSNRITGYTWTIVQWRWFWGTLLFDFHINTKVLQRRQVLCHHCRGTGAEDPNDIQNCNTCGGSGVQIQEQKLGPGFIQRVQVTYENIPHTFSRHWIKEASALTSLLSPELLLNMWTVCTWILATDLHCFSDWLGALNVMVKEKFQRVFVLIVMDQKWRLQNNS